MSERLIQKIGSYIKQQQLIAAGDIVLVGVSGGADSMCLLEVLRAYRETVDFELKVIHVEHGIRGEESLTDAAYVQRFCDERSIPCEIVRVDACAAAKEKKLSVEEAARELRYEAFEKQAREAESEHASKYVPAAAPATVKIAVAHHREDQAETVLWQMIRGSDTKGLGGMRARRGRLIRPLLCVDKSEIEAFLRGKGIAWREDATNGDRTYTRNRLRLDVLPVLAELNDQSAEHLCETAERLQETEDYLTEETDRRYEKHTQTRQGGELMIRESLLEEPPLMQRRVLYRALETVCGSAKDLGKKHVALLRELFSLQVGRELHFPYEVTALRTYEGVTLSRVGVSDVTEQLQEEVFLPEQVHMEVLEEVPFSEISKKKYTKWFDYDKIKHSVQIRERRSGDYLTIDRDGHRQKLKSYLVNEKIPQEKRDRLLLLADGAHIMWVIGYRISDYYKVDENTKRVLKVQLSGGREDE